MFANARTTLSDADYRGQLAALFTVIRDAADLDRATARVEQRLALILDPRFLGEFLAYLNASPMERVTMLMLNLPIDQALKNVPPDQLGPAGIALAFFFTEGDTATFFSKFAPYLSTGFYEALDSIATATESRYDLDESMGRPLIHSWRERGRRMLFAWAALLLNEPLQLVLEVPAAQFLTQIVHNAQGMLGNTLLQLHSIHQHFKAGDADETQVAFCAWVTERAVNLANELPAAQPLVLVDMLRFDAGLALRDWLQAATPGRREDGHVACMYLLRWLSALPDPASAPPPLPTFQRLTEVTSASQVRQLVYEEPSILVEQNLIGGYDKDGIFVNSWFPILTGDPDTVVMIVKELERLRDELGSATRNPIIALAHSVNEGEITMDEAANRLLGRGRIDEMLLIGADYAAAEAHRYDYSFSRTLVELNWRLAEAVSHHPTLVATLATSIAGISLNDREAFEARELARRAVALARPLGHAVLLPAALYSLGRSLEAAGDANGAAQAYTEGFDTALAIPPSYGRDDLLFALADLAYTVPSAGDKRQHQLDEMAFYLDLVEHYGVAEEESTGAARYWAMRGRYFWAKGASVESAEAWERSAGIASRMGELMMVPELVADAVRAQRSNEALSLLNELLRAAEQQGPTVEAAVLATRKMALLLDMSRRDADLPAAYEQFQRLVSASGAENSVRLGMLIKQVKIGYLKRMGDRDQVDEILSEVGTRINNMDPGDWAMWQLTRAEDLTKHDDFAGARALLDQVEAQAGKIPASVLSSLRFLHGVIAARHGQALARSGRSTEAAEARQAAARNWRQVAEDKLLNHSSRISTLNNLCLLYRQCADLAGLRWAVHLLAELYDEADTAG